MHQGDVRTANLLGVVALTLSERVREATEAAAGVGGGAAAALVHLQHQAKESVGGLGRVLGLSQPGAVRLADRLVGLGLVVRAAPGSGDRRSVELSLTAAGKQRAGLVQAARAAALQAVLSELDKDVTRALAPLLEQLARALPRASSMTEPVARDALLHLCRMCDRAACRRDTGCPLEGQGR